MLYVRYENNKRARGGRDYRLSGNAEEDEMLGSAGPAYRLIYVRRRRSILHSRADAAAQ
jgi:hypothetical protein